MPEQERNRQKLLGLLKRRERWELSRRGWIAAGSIVLLAATTAFLGIHPFLAATKRVDADILVVEGWVPDPVIEATIKEFHAGYYKRILSTGGPPEWSGGFTSDRDTAAIWGAGRLLRRGIPKEVVQMVPARSVGRDRTYSTAVALRDWFRDHQMNVRGVNVVTEDAHARRTWLLFQKALGPKITVGIIAVPNPDYDTAHWWRTSEGVRDVLGESIAYLYARLFFWPAAPQ